MGQSDVKKKLLDALISVVRYEQFKDLLGELHTDSLGEEIIAGTDFSGIHRINVLRLLNACGNHTGGLEKLWDVLQLLVAKSHKDWPRLEQSFQAYQEEKRHSRQADQLDLTNCVHSVSILGIALRTRLHALANNHTPLAPKDLQTAIAKAMARAYPAAIPAHLFPSVFGTGPITHWDDLLSRTSHDPFELDERFLSAFEEVLALAKSGHSQLDPAGLSSLLVMVLRPPHLPASAECPAYSFRAYICSQEAASPDQWIRLDDKATGYPIRATAWIADLQPLLTKAIAASSLHRQTTHPPLLLEVFLPKEFLNEDFGELIKMRLPTGDWDPLNKYYPIVLRSSDRYQFFHEGQAKEFPNPLPAKWEQAQRMAAAAEPSSHWWHDPTPASRKHSPSAEKQIEKHFDSLRVNAAYFALKRSANLPTCPRLRQKWLDRMIWACPAVALWWRPQAKSRQPDRGESLRLCCGDPASPLEPNQPSEPAPQSARFTHPDVASPLKLFHSFASEVFHGRLSDAHSLALGEMVLLVDSHQRWPPPLDCSPSSERKSDRGAGVITVSAEEIYLSG